MPLHTLHLLSLHPTASLHTDILPPLRPLHPLTTALIHRWIILPSSPTSPLLAHPWHLLLILPAASALPPSLAPHTAATLSLTFALPTRLLTDYHARNAALLHPDPGAVPPLSPAGAALRDGKTDEAATGDAQGLELSAELLSWMRGAEAPRGAVAMLNVLAFVEGRKGEYVEYGRRFGAEVGARRGGLAKVVGRVMPEGGEWDEVALAHYPSVWHFADMLVGADYQEVNKRWRVGSLRDTGILCTEEVEMGEGKARL